jgi:hypothetical protein
MIQYKRIGVDEGQTGFVGYLPYPRNHSIRQVAFANANGVIKDWRRNHQMDFWVAF